MDKWTKINDIITKQIYLFTKYLEKTKYDELNEKIIQLIKMISSFINHINKKSERENK